MTSRRAVWTTVVVAVVGTLLRLSTTLRGWFYWDDLTLLAQAREYDAPTAELLFTPHDGHLMPGSWLLIWFFGSATDGFNWPAAVTALALGTALAIAAVAYAAWRINPTHAWWVTGVYALTPLTLPVTTWAAAAVNSLPLHAASALWLAHGWLYLRHGRTRDFALAVAAIAVAGAFSERVLMLAPISAVLILCWPRAQAPARRVAFLLGGFAAATAAWALTYAVVVGDPRPTVGDLSSIPGLMAGGYLKAFFPTLVGGPWTWDRWHPGPPFASLTVVAVILGVAAVVVLLFLAYRHRALLSGIIVFAYPLLPFLAIALARSGDDTAIEITQTLRHFAEVAVLLALTLAVHAHTRLNRSAQAALALFAASSLVSTVTYGQSWAEQPARDYFTTLEEELKERNSPIHDQAVPLEVLLPVVHPYNQLSSLLPDGHVSPATREPALVGPTGELHAAELAPQRATDGDLGCINPGETRSFALDGPLVDRDWVLRLNVNAAAAGDISVAIGDGEPVTVPLTEGLQQWHVQFEGGGEELAVTATGTETCLGRSEVGLLVS